MKKLLSCSLLIMALALSGCVMRLIPQEKDRVDQELTGNRGMIMGNPKDLPESKKGKRKTRTVYDLEIEFSSPVDAKKVEKTDVRKEEISKEKYWNKGYVSTKTVSEKNLMPVEKKSSSSVLLMSSGHNVVYQKAGAAESKYKKETGEGAIAAIKQEESRTYVVEKGDTLQKISEKMYGTTKRWKKIYEANKDALKSPDMIKVGQRLVIPE